jgi:curved DNA-binding protein CbpA
MGLEPDAKGADVKRRYMRLSLLIHPDKCGHPQAQRAFQAVSKASKQLQVKLSVYDQRSSYPITFLMSWSAVPPAVPDMLRKHN